MDQFQTCEGKLLFITYYLYKSNRIGIEQKSEIKGDIYNQFTDMLIAKDFRIQQVMQEIRNETNVQKIERMLENINVRNINKRQPEEHSPRDIDDNLSHTYKQKRPKLFKFQKSNFSKFIEAKANEDTDTFSSNKQLEFRQRLYSLAADSC
ncbi:unnamed protein product (macronuclear) [Paramecium tetraurelia]|uniref:Uncharacterized protein n=1 Tax=Paramecium tetraurelia TaxID=5888 RepID=A0E5B3_PARTE|nr:uncharacterized protein GSPATT00023657001 [Paramecium tetraurelia]CAK90480.1 unnamed protein product [Paramecium tetraurelia]|eukprot:XP_001457877.1 hypothetical protein (macronuclear) [Paramecium tetraurelia strain d4-2]